MNGERLGAFRSLEKMRALERRCPQNHETQTRYHRCPWRNTGNCRDRHAGCIAAICRTCASDDWPVAGLLGLQAEPSQPDSIRPCLCRDGLLACNVGRLAVAFDSAFRKKLYPQVTLFQDLLGTVNDHATAGMRFRDWLSKSEDTEQKVFLEGLLLAEERATEDLRAAFLATWTPKVMSGLKRQFRAYC